MDIHLNVQMVFSPLFLVNQGTIAVGSKKRMAPVAAPPVAPAGDGGTSRSHMMMPYRRHMTPDECHMTPDKRHMICHR